MSIEFAYCGIPSLNRVDENHRQRGNEYWIPILTPNHPNELTMAQKENPPRTDDRGGFMCPRLDSNQHVLANTTPSRWRVYQFHHVGLLEFGLQI